MAVIEDQPDELPSSTPKRSAAAGSRFQAKVYSLEDVLKHTAEGGGEEAPASKKARKFGVWSEVPIDEGADWGQCPLGKLMWD